MKKILCYSIIYTFFVILVVPFAITGMSGNILPKTVDNNVTDAKEDAEYETKYKVDLIKALNPETNEIIEDAFEDYIKGVLGAEMPASFEPEALKAQAVAARTYAYKKIKDSQVSNDISELNNIGQAYESVDELKNKWGANFDKYYDKISDAVNDTYGEIMVYNDEPILAVFHSTSNGKTEDAKNVWGSDVEYLKSVDSSFDINAPGYEESTRIPASTVMGKLQEYDKTLILTQTRLLDQMQIVERSSSGYILKIQVGNKYFTGRQIREILGLKSSCFSISQDGDNIIFTTKGYGHGAGMSQYGANFMAKDGYTYDKILEHYYQNIKITKMN